jgi:galactokinase/galacturonokinase
MKCENIFSQLYHRDPVEVAFCPYRVCPIGAHVDHQHGLITGLAIDKGVHFAYGPKKNGVVELSSVQFDRRAQWHIRQVDEKPTGDWADYLRGATWALAKYYDLHTGICGVIEGTLPIGGLSSSAAVIIVFLAALAKLNGIALDQQEMIRLAYEAEHDYVGVSVGTLDQSYEVLSRKNHLLYLDTMDGSYELIPQRPDMKPYKIAIMFSGIERTLVGSKFNMRVDEAKSAAYALKAFAGLEYGKFNDTRLRDIPVAIYNEYKERLPETWRKRAEHYFTEFDRVQRGAEAWRRGDIEAYGKLSFESGHSSVYSWETGSDELRTLYQIMTHTDGIYGGRFSGAGFKGCCMALIDPAFAESIERTVTAEYLKIFPQLEGKYSFHLCDSADGISL